MKNIIMINILSILLLLGCKSPLNQIDNAKKLEQIEVRDSSLLRAIDSYPRKYLNSNLKGLLVVYSKNINDKKKVKYLNHIYGLSNIFLHPISSYFVYKNDTILVYSKKDNFLNPRNYPRPFISSMKSCLTDDWTLIENEAGALMFSNSFSNHSKPWKISKNKIDSTNQFNFQRAKFLYGDVDFFYTDYDNLDSLRIVPFKGNG